MIDDGPPAQYKFDDPKIVTGRQETRAIDLQATGRLHLPDIYAPNNTRK